MRVSFRDTFDNEERVRAVMDEIAEERRIGVKQRACWACANGVSGVTRSEQWTVCLLTGDDVDGVRGMECFEEGEWE